jgi:hypothetical protein
MATRVGYSYNPTTGIHSWLSYDSFLKNIVATTLALGNLFFSYDILISSLIQCAVVYIYFAGCLPYDGKSA